MNVRSLLLALLALGLLSPAPVAHADLVAPGHVETCTLVQQRRDGEECIECSASFQDATACTTQFLQAGYTARCRTAGASVWREIGCRAVGAAPTPVVSPTPVAPEPVAPAPEVSPPPITPTPAPITPTPTPVAPTPANDPGAQPAPSPARGMCSASTGRADAGRPAVGLLALGLALVVSRRRR